MTADDEMKIVHHPVNSTRHGWDCDCCTCIVARSWLDQYDRRKRFTVEVQYYKRKSDLPGTIEES
jgi:hypothetical protein